MIFVSYSHADKKWRKRFETMSKPLSRATSMEFWSDRKLKGGEWEKQITAAMEKAEAVVFLVSPAFLASDYIMNQEVRYFVKAQTERRLMIFWAYLEPCDLRWHPEITKFQAMTLGELKPLSSLTDWQWQETMLRGCGMIDEVVKTLEKPIIDHTANNKRLERRTENFQLLSAPARRFVEVLVYSPDKKWYRQSGVNAGCLSTTIHLGNDKTASGTAFKVVALTTYQRLTEESYLNFPDYRTKSEEITLHRA